LQDFSTIIEAQNSTRADGIGRLIQIWKCYSSTAEGMTRLSHYSRHLPKMALLLEQALPSKLSCFLKHMV
ncbi:hypothetical protein DFH28DRAFT_828398, partial [Melampsora americana]